MTIAAPRGNRRQRHESVHPSPSNGVTRGAHGGSWLGEPGEPIRSTVRVEAISPQAHGRVTYRLRDEQSNALLEWTSARRYGFHLGETLRIAGRVYRHTTRAGLRITEIRECFNPMRLT